MGGGQGGEGASAPGAGSRPSSRDSQVKPGTILLMSSVAILGLFGRVFSALDSLWKLIFSEKRSNSLTKDISL